MERMNGKIALVTGGSRGIGRAIARRLARDGVLVAVHYGRNRNAAEEVVREIEHGGGQAFELGADLSSVNGIETLYAQLDMALNERVGSAQFDILINNAGIGMSASIDETTEAAFNEVVAINMKAPFFLIQQALPRLRNGGSIVNLSSSTTRISLPAICAYTMTKGAINAMTLALANQLGPRGITINAVQPGFVATDMNAAMLNDSASRQFGADFSIFGRWGEPEDIADVATFLASPDGRWITGQVIDASGGSHL